MDVSSLPISASTDDAVLEFLLGDGPAAGTLRLQGVSLPPDSDNPTVFDFARSPWGEWLVAAQLSYGGAPWAIQSTMDWYCAALIDPNAGIAPPHEGDAPSWPACSLSTSKL